MAMRSGILAGVAVLALLVNGAVGLRLGLSKEVISDAHYYQQLAHSVADGEGYRVKDGFWPDAPSMRRMPAWPLLVAGLYTVGGDCSPDLTMRLLALLLNAGVAVLVAMLALRLFQRPRVAGLAGGIYAVHPMALTAAYGGMSEPLFLVLGLAGVLCLLKQRRLVQFSGAVLLGLAVLARANFVLWGGGALLLLAAVTLIGRKANIRAALTVCLLACAFLFPVSIWLTRNALVTGHFPVLSTLRGQTHYGGNNEVVANELGQWGYWVFPDRIPGEIPMRQLAQSMSEYEVDAYYYQRGTGFVSSNLRSMPRLWLGKLLRAYGPIPWNPSLGGYAQGSFRFCIFILAAVGACLAWRRLPAVFLCALVSMIGVNLLTVLVFWGSPRFSLAIEPFLLPLAAHACFRIFAALRTKLVSAN